MKDLTKAAEQKVKITNHYRVKVKIQIKEVERLKGEETRGITPAPYNIFFLQNEARL